jgi:hypothetical protein
MTEEILLAPNEDTGDGNDRKGRLLQLLHQWAWG